MSSERRFRTIEEVLAAGGTPRPGDGGFLEWLADRRPQLTEREWRELRLLHFNLFRLLAPPDPRGPDGVLEDVLALGATELTGEDGVRPPVCGYPHHRAAGDWLTRDGRRVCRVCHPPAPGAEGSA